MEEEVKVLKMYKYACKSPEDSCRIQKEWFEMGYKWYNMRHMTNVPVNTDNPYLYGDSIGIITYGVSHSFFDERTHYELYTPKGSMRKQLKENDPLGLLDIK